MRAKLREVKAELWERLHEPVKEVGQWLRSVVGGHFRYYGVAGNYRALHQFRRLVGWLWRRTLRRRSQKGRCSRARMERLIQRWLPLAQIHHSYSLARMPL